MTISDLKTKREHAVITTTDEAKGSCGLSPGTDGWSVFIGGDDDYVAILRMICGFVRSTGFTPIIASLYPRILSLMLSALVSS
jgi:hypothetical protein